MTSESEILNKPYKSGIDKLKRKEEEGEEKNELFEQGTQPLSEQRTYFSSYMKLL